MNAGTGWRAAHAAVAVVTMASTAATANAGTIIDFEDLTPGAMYNVGDVVATGGVDVHFMEFFWLPSGSTTNGHAEVWDTQQYAGGSGQDLETNNINAYFDFVHPLTELTLLYGEYGGNVNLSINGDFRNEDDFDVLDGTMVGGVAVSIVDLGNELRRMELHGSIDTFGIGGQELWMDDVTYAIPGPGAMACLAAGITLLGRRRRGW